MTAPRPRPTVPRHSGEAMQPTAPSAPPLKGRTARGAVSGRSAHLEQGSRSGALIPTTPPPPERLTLVHFRGKTRRGPQRLTKELVEDGRLKVASLPPAPRQLREMWAHDLRLGVDPWAEIRPSKENQNP